MGDKHILVLSSFYPTPGQESNGVFVKEQHLAFAEMYPDWHTTVLLSEFEDCLSLRSLKHWPGQITRYLSKSRTTTRQLLPNLVEMHDAGLRLSHRLMGQRLIGLQKKHIAYSQLIKAIKKHGPVGLIHAHTVLPAGVIAYSLSKRTSIPLVITEHACPFPCPPFVNKKGALRREIAASYQHARMVTAPSPYQLEQLQSCGIHNSVVLPNMVDDRIFVSRESSKKLSEFNFISIAVDLSDPRKGIKLLLEAFFIMHSTLPETVRKTIFLRLVGDYKNAKSLVNWSLSQPGGHQVLWLGPLTRGALSHTFHQSDCLVLPSESESFSMICAEAIACGIPVIATRCGGPEFIVQQEVGELVGSSRSEHLVPAMLRMYHHSHSYSPAAIRANFMRRFSRQTVLPQLKSLYGQIIGSD